VLLPRCADDTDRALLSIRGVAMRPAVLQHE
jgi:hypothetical protein